MTESLFGCRSRNRTGSRQFSETRVGEGIQRFGDSGREVGCGVGQALTPAPRETAGRKLNMGAPVTWPAKRDMRQRERAHCRGYSLKKLGTARISDDVAFELDDLQALNDGIEVLAERR